jgi:indolepyruvate ferredoxin oxidoreductase
VVPTAKEVVMNAPLPDSVRRALASLTLDDKYALDHGRAFMSGVQALVRLPMLQRTRDVAAGLNTAGFISGYRGSPLGAYDQSLWKARSHLQQHQVVFQPGVNEELAATAVWGSQQLDLYPDQRRFDGVFGLWYGKGPGVDRSVDVFKHANMAGTARHGGVIAVAGDDHVAKSSSLAHQSDHVFKACGIPVFFPANVQEILDLGLHAWALSRFSGLWAGLKTIQEVVESSTSVWIDPDRVDIVLPEFDMPEGGLHIRWPDTALAQEARLMDHKWYAALAYVRANRLNHTVIDSPDARLGLIASGKAYNDTRQALVDLGIDDALAARLGLRVHKVGVVWPLEASITREFATGLQEILVIEEKRQMIEYQLKEELYNWREDVRPQVLGKFGPDHADRSGGEWSRPNPSGHWLLRAKADLNPALIAKAVAQRLEATGLLARVDADVRRHVAERLAVIEGKEREAEVLLATTGSAERPPWFCSGCPHNTSTRVPEGSRAMAGIGCHYMVNWMDRRTSTFTAMGGEGVGWVGQAPFTNEAHVFANLGDGTYFHSGLLAVRQSIAARVNITYKILYNDAVAMTGGQPLDGNLSVPAITRELQAEGVVRTLVLTDDPAKYDEVDDLAPGVTVHHRDELDALQRELRATPGCTALVYDQTCATELRRRRKRGKAPMARSHVVIHETVCEGCGDCSVQSNCLSVEPVDTPLGRKRRINPSSCNQDLSCLKGFCPSLLTVEGTDGQAPRLKAPQAQAGATTTRAAAPVNVQDLPEPDVPAAPRPWGIVVAGVGGTGVITIGQLLGVAAHIEGKGVITQDAAGLAQKGGATWSHIQIADDPACLHTTRVPTAEADLVMACDAIVAAQPTTLSVMAAGRTHLALNTHGAPTAAVVRQPGWRYPEQACDTVLQTAVGDDGSGQRLARFDAQALAEGLLGDALFTNPLMLGYCWQKGWIPLSREALCRAIELNASQVAQNLAAFDWGRRAALDLPGVMRQALPAQPVAWVPRAHQAEPGSPAEPLQALMARHMAFLTQYQNAAWARRYEGSLQPLRALSAHEALCRTAAQQLFRLMAYKDEYEVARLLSDRRFHAQVAEQYEGPVQLRFHLAPPVLGERKRAFGPGWRWALSLLAHGKVLRGTVLDPLGHTAERRTERALITRYVATVQAVVARLSSPSHASIAGQATLLKEAQALLQMPESIKGFGPVKARALAQVLPRWDEALRQWRSGGA